MKVKDTLNFTSHQLVKQFILASLLIVKINQISFFLRAFYIKNHIFEHKIKFYETVFDISNGHLFCL